MALDKKELGERIKEARKLKGQKINKKYTGQDLANDLLISRSYLGDIESGRSYPSYRLLSKIANFCDVPLSFFGDSDLLLKEIIDNNLALMDEDEKANLIDFIKTNMNMPDGRIVDWELSTWKEVYDDFKTTSEIESMRKEDYKNEIEFKTPQEAMKFILEQPAIMGFGGFDANKMSDEEIMEFANELLNQLKLLGYKYKK